MPRESNPWTHVQWSLFPLIPFHYVTLMFSQPPPPPFLFLLCAFCVQGSFCAIEVKLHVQVKVFVISQPLPSISLPFTPPVTPLSLYLSARPFALS